MNDLTARAIAKKSLSQSPQYQKQCHRWNFPGNAHALTFSCFQRQRFLSRDRSRGWMADAICLACERHRFHIWAYVIMPEHVHLLVCPEQSKYDISKFLATMKQSVSQTSKAYLRKNAPHFLPRMADRASSGKTVFRFWQRGGGYDRNIDEPQIAWFEINYIHANPVRRALCQRPVDWFWSSAADYAGVRQGPIPIDRQPVPRLT